MIVREKESMMEIYLRREGVSRYREGKEEERQRDRKRQTARDKQREREKDNLVHVFICQICHVCVRYVMCVSESVVCVSDLSCVCQICHVCVSDLSCVCQICHVSVSSVMCVINNESANGGTRDRIK